MDFFLFYFLTIFLLDRTQCEMRLQITKNINDFFTPVTTPLVEEREGSSFSLICELISSNDNSNSVDENLIWVVKSDSNSSLSKRKRTSTNRAINTSEKKFNPLKVEDRGIYYCISQKYNLTKSVRVLVIESMRRNDVKPIRETIFCNEHMFQCMSNGLCIIPHYVCDGKSDCKDGSDETLEKCNGDPCRDKIPCDDGRCIPSSWCCDRHHDLNCTVTNRPKCCQSIIMPESYEELEYGYPNVNHNQHNGARYLFISVCIVSILFSIVLLMLIVSKVVIFAKKSALQRQNTFEDIALRNQNNVNIIRATNIYTVRNNSRTPRSNIIIESSDMTDPLLYNSVRFKVTNNSGTFADQPPSYVDVLRNNGLISEPPPPYTSREILNVHEEQHERS